MNSPTKTPTMRANIKPLIDSPPKVKMANNTIKVVKDVFKVLLSVEFKALLTLSINFQLLYHLYTP